jgi:hypothetical protein
LPPAGTSPKPIATGTGAAEHTIAARRHPAVAVDRTLIDAHGGTA